MFDRVLNSKEYLDIETYLSKNGVSKYNLILHSIAPRLSLKNMIKSELLFYRPLNKLP